MYIYLYEFQVLKSHHQTYEKLLTNKTEHIFTDSWFVLSLSSFSVCLYCYAACASERCCRFRVDCGFSRLKEGIQQLVAASVGGNLVSGNNFHMVANVIVMPHRDWALSSAGCSKRNKASLSICFPFPGNRQQNPEYQSGARLNCSSFYQPVHHLPASSRLQLFPSELDNERVLPGSGDQGHIEEKNLLNGNRSRLDRMSTRVSMNIKLYVLQFHS